MLSLGFLIKANTAEATEQLEKFAVNVDAISAGLGGKLNTVSSVIKNKLLQTLPAFGLVAGAVTAVGGALVEMAEHASEAGAKLYLASRATGLSVESLQGLQLAAKEAGIDFDMVQRAMAHLAVNMSTLTEPSSEGAKAFKMLGISTTDANGNMKSMDVLLPQIMDKLAGMKDGAQKTAIAAELLGTRVGAYLLPIMDKGSKSFEELTKKAVEYSGITTEVAEKDEAFQEKMIELKAAFHGVAQQIMQTTIPALTYLSNFFLRAWDEARNLAAAFGILGDHVNIFVDHLLHMTKMEADARASLVKDQAALHQSAEDYRNIGKEADFYADRLKAIKQNLDSSTGSEKAHAITTRDDAAAMQEASRRAFEESSAFQQMRRQVELTNEAQQKAADLAHQQIETAEEHTRIGAGEPGGLVQLPQTMATISTTLPIVKEKADAATASFTGLTQMINNMAASFGRGGAGAAQFSQSMQQVIAAHERGMPIMRAFLLAQRQQGETAKEAGTSMALSYGMEAASFIKNKKAQAIIMAVMETAKGLSESFWNPAAAALDFASAAMYGVIAGTSPGQSGGGGGGARSESSRQGATGQGVVGQSGRGGGGSSRYHQTVVNIWGGQITDTNNLQNLVTTLNQGGQSGMIRMNVAGTSATIPTPAY